MKIWYTGAYAEAVQGLDIKGYAGKWKVAREMAHTPNQENYFLPYWERARLLFFALGGERIDRRRV